MQNPRPRIAGNFAWYGGLLGRAAPGQALAENDIVYCSGVSGSLGLYSKASTENAAIYASLFIVARAGSRGDLVVVPAKLVFGLDTDAAAAVGAPVYLGDDDAAGEWSLAPADTAIERIVGHVVVKDATAGAIMFGPVGGLIFAPQEGGGG